MIAEELIAFEAEIATLFKAGKIRAPVHLYSGGEEALIDIFQGIRHQDWVLCSWRSHYQCLLKGVPKDELRAKILAGYSIALSFPEYRIFSSGIVGGVLPIAVGIGMAIKRTGEDARVHCFMGDMTSQTGITHECVKYAWNFGLPVQFHIEDNGVSVCTDTKAVWGISDIRSQILMSPNVDYFNYEAGKYPHAGSGERVQF